MTPTVRPIPAPGVVVVGDALVDVVEDGGRTCTAGGAGFNLAAGVHLLGTNAFLACPISSDEFGGWLRDAIKTAGVTLIPLASSQPTGVATSRRVAGEPTYDFSQSLYQRHYCYTAAQVPALAAGNVIVVNSFPMHVQSQVTDLIELVALTGQILVVDPNARPSLLVERDAYRTGLLRLAGEAQVVKLSVQDVVDLDAGDAVTFVQTLLSVGVRAVVLTEAEHGASVYTAEGLVVSRPVSTRPEPVVDTMGAGDATLACLTAEFAARGGVELDEATWGDLLSRAMDLAADVCRIKGGNLAGAQLTTATIEGADG